MHVGKTTMVTALALAIALAIGCGSAARAEPGGGIGSASAVARSPLPDGWTLEQTTSGADLSWQAPERVRTGDAMVEFYAGERLLGRPRAGNDQRTFHLVIDGTAARNLTDLQVRAGGRRLDATADPTVPAADRTDRTAATAQRLATAPVPANPVDPGVAGNYSTVSGDYSLPDVHLPGLAKPVEMQAVVVAPQDIAGPRPLVLLMHGRHDTCYQGTTGLITAWPCPTGWTTLENHRGYPQTQQLLASQGYVTVSISANGITAQDNGPDEKALPPEDGGAQARSSLVRLHLGRWADWAGTGRADAPNIVQSAPVADMSRVLLMGHSRGGEGVSRAAIDSLTPPPTDQDGYRGTVRWQIRGLALIGPTTFGQNPAPDVPSVVILPSCDGDIADLQGQMYVDAARGVSRGSALHSSVYVLGANHNYFNTQWSPGQSPAYTWEDYPSRYDPVCRADSPMRLTPEVQQRAGATYIAAAAATFVAGNDQVRPLLDGSGVRAASADPATVLTHAVGGNRTPLLVPDASTVVTGTGARLCEAVTNVHARSCERDTPHFAPLTPVRPEAGRYAVALSWSAAGTPVSARRSTPTSVSGAQSVALRIIVAADSVVPMDVAIVDSAGRRATLGRVTVTGMPRPTQTVSEWGQEVRVPLASATAAGLDLTRITAVEVVPHSPLGWAWLLDAWGWRPGTPSPRPIALPRVDVGELTVLEGNSGTTTYQVPARVSGSGTGQVRVFVVDPATGLATARVVTVSPGMTTISIPVSVTGNAQPGDGRTHMVAVKAVKGVLVGDAYGSLTVQDDDS